MLPESAVSSSELQRHQQVTIKQIKWRQIWINYYI